jgi:hypothetical protein
MSLLAQEGLVGVLGALFGFGYLALLIYLIIRFIEVADDVRAIRRSVQDGAGSSLRAEGSTSRACGRRGNCTNAAS